MSRDLPPEVVKRILDNIICLEKPKISFYLTSCYMSKYLFKDDIFDIFFIRNCVKGLYFNDFFLFLISQNKTYLVKIFIVFHKQHISQNLFRKGLKNTKNKEIYLTLFSYVPLSRWIGYAVPWSASTGDLELFKNWYLFAEKKHINTYKLIKHSLRCAIDRDDSHCVEWILNEILYKYEKNFLNDLLEVWNNCIYYILKRKVFILLLNDNFLRHIDTLQYVRALKTTASQLDLNLLTILCERREINWDLFGIEIYNSLYNGWGCMSPQKSPQNKIYDCTSFLLDKLIVNHRLSDQIDKNLILQLLYKGVYTQFSINNNSLYYEIKKNTLKILSGMGGISYAC